MSIIYSCNFCAAVTASPIVLCGECASKRVESTPSASHNSAMVPCPQHDAIDAGCPLNAHKWLCGTKPCMIELHQSLSGVTNIFVKHSKELVCLSCMGRGRVWNKHGISYSCEKCGGEGIRVKKNIVLEKDDNKAEPYQVDLVPEIETDRTQSIAIQIAKAMGEKEEQDIFIALSKVSMPALLRWRGMIDKAIDSQKPNENKS